MLKSIIFGLLLMMPFAASENKKTNPVEQLDSKSLKCLADNIFYEAGNQSIEGKIALAYVTVNRTKDKRFPETVCGVVKQRNQFSWVGNKEYQKRHVRSERDWRWKESQFVAETFRLYPDPTNGGLFFHEVSINPDWKYKKVARIQNHIFYKFKD